ncbi:MAG TPA: hypothetical protein VLA13_00360, partial [Massilibacterium sp.]|nr:hypothetical protein [Massilibacterium sp.]
MKDFRPRLPESEDWKELIDFSREYGPKEVLNRFLRTLNSSKESIEHTENGSDYIIRSESERIKTLDDLIEAVDIDTDQYEIYRYLANKYDQHSVEKGLVELYQVKAWMNKKYLDKPDASYYNKWLEGLEKIVTPVKLIETSSEDKPITLAIADMHVGAFIEGDHLTPDYNVEEIRERLTYIAGYANSYNRPVHVKILGDFIESFSARNHKDTWKQIELHGMEVALAAYDLTSEFLQKLEQPASI